MKRIIGRINPDDRNVTIWGAGFAGLVLGYYLKQQGYKVTIYERSNRAGGKIGTKKTPFGMTETGPNALYLNADGLELLRELKLEPIPATKKLRRLLMLNGKPKKAFQVGVISRLALNAYRKPPLISDGLTVAEFFRPLVGTDIINRYLTPVLGGIYAAPCETLHFKSIFDLAASKAQFESYWEFIRMLLKARKSEPKLDIQGSVSFEGGMQTLIDRLAEIMKPDIKLNYKEALRIKGNTIICTPAFNAAELTQDIYPEISAELKRIRYQELSTITVFLKREIRSLQRAFGVLIPLGSEYNCVGILNNKAIFPENNSNVFSYTLISRKIMTKNELCNDLKLLSPEFDPENIEHFENTHWEKAIPLYDLQRYLSIKRLHQLVKNDENLAIFGNYVAGVSMREMIPIAKHFAQTAGREATGATPF